LKALTNCGPLKYWLVRKLLQSKLISVKLILLTSNYKYIQFEAPTSPYVGDHFESNWKPNSICFVAILTCSFLLLNIVDNFLSFWLLIFGFAEKYENELL
jgi:hypothetical protein